MRNLKKQIKVEAEVVSEALFNLLSKFRFPKVRSIILLKIAFVFAFLFISSTGHEKSMDGASAMVH